MDFVHFPPFCFASNIILVAVVSLALNCVCTCCCTYSEPTNGIDTATLQVPSAPQLSYMAMKNNFANNGTAEKLENFKVMYVRDQRDGQDVITII